MGLGEWVFLVTCLGISGLGTYMWIRVKHPRVFHRIPREIQAEIDVSPEWWDAQFRKLQGLPETPKTVVGDLQFSIKHLIDPKPPTPQEIWTPSTGSTYDISVDLSAMMSAIQEAKTND